MAPDTTGPVSLREGTWTQRHRNGGSVHTEGRPVRTQREAAGGKRRGRPPEKWPPARGRGLGPLDSDRTNTGQGPACAAFCRGSCYRLSLPWSPASLTQARSPYGTEGKGAPCPSLQEGSGPSCGSQSAGPPHRYWPQGWRPGTTNTEVLSVSFREMSTRSREGNRVVYRREPGCRGADGTEDRGAQGTRPARLLAALLQRGGMGLGRARGSHGHRFGGITLQWT